MGSKIEWLGLRCLSHQDGNLGGHSSDPVEVPDDEGIPDDFLLLAEQALRGLEVEHMSTLERSVPAVDGTADVSNGNLNEPTQPTEFDACFPSFDENLDGINTQTDENGVDSTDTTTEAAAPTGKKESAGAAKNQVKELKPLKYKPMDVNPSIKIATTSH